MDLSQIQVTVCPYKTDTFLFTKHKAPCNALLSTLFTATLYTLARVFDHVVVIRGEAIAAGRRGNAVIVASDTILNAPEGSNAIKQLFARDAVSISQSPHSAD